MNLKFSRKLYSEGAVRAAVKRFRDYATFRVRKTPQAFLVSVSGVDAGMEDQLRGEFYNFALLAARDA